MRFEYKEEMKMNRRTPLALLLPGSMRLPLPACGGGNTAPTPTPDAQSSAAVSETPQSEGPEQVTAPITITFWHDRTSDTDYEFLKKSIQEFNDTNEYGITVEEVAQGYLDDVQAAIETGIAAGETPVLADLSCNGIPLFASEGILADMTPYVERDGFDMDNVVKVLTAYVYYGYQIGAWPDTGGTAISI